MICATSWSAHCITCSAIAHGREGSVSVTTKRRPDLRGDRRDASRAPGHGQDADAERAAEAAATINVKRASRVSGGSYGEAIIAADPRQHLAMRSRRRE